MSDLSVDYMGLKLRNPIIIGSSGLTDKTESIRNLEQNGAAAIVLKSLFEEEIINEMDIKLSAMSSSNFIYPETLEFYDYFEGPKETTTSYLELIRETKSKLSIPIIASINCVDSQNWTYFPKQIEQAGAR